jgi:hypothetical protein
MSRALARHGRFASRGGATSDRKLHVRMAEHLPGLQFLRAPVLRSREHLRVVPQACMSTERPAPVPDLRRPATEYTNPWGVTLAAPGFRAS